MSSRDIGMSCVLRQATAEDVPSIVLLQQQWELESVTYGLVADSPTGIELQLNPYFQVATLDDQLVGFISGKVVVSDGLAVVPQNEPYLEISELYVLPSLRSSGVGGKLVDSQLATARRNGLRKALVYSATKDIYRVLRFYEDHGFRSWFVQMHRDL